MRDRKYRGKSDTTGGKKYEGGGGYVLDLTWKRILEECRGRGERGGGGLGVFRQLEGF